MGSERLYDRPHRLEGRGIQSLLGLLVLADEDREHDRANGLVRCEANRPPDRLHDVHLRAAWVDKSDAVDGGHVHALGEAARIAE